MKLKSFLVVFILSAVAIATICWSVWSATAIAQDDVSSPVVSADELPSADTIEFPLSKSGEPEFKLAQPKLSPPGNSLVAQPRTVKNQLQNPQLQPGTATTTNRRFGYFATDQPQTTAGTPIGLPGPPTTPFIQYSTRQNAVPYGYPLPPASADPETVELTKGYQAKQVEINKLLATLAKTKSDKEKESLREDIVKATAEQFDLRQQVREREIEQLRKRLSEVESTVKKRNELKDEIVNKRVADLLREPDQLSWEPLAGGGVIERQVVRQYGVPPQPASSFTQPAQPNSSQAPKPAAVTYEPRTVTRAVTETIVDADGTQRKVTRPVKETEYVPRTNSKQSSKASSTFSPPATPNQQHGYSDYTNSVNPRLAGNAPYARAEISVAEAAAKVEIAENRYIEVQSKRGNVSRTDLKTRESELELAGLILAQAKTAFAGRTKLLELDVKQAKAEVDHATAAFNDAMEARKRVSSAATSSEVTTRRAAVEKSKIELERAQIMLELHLQGSERASQSAKPKATTPDALDNALPKQP